MFLIWFKNIGLLKTTKAFLAICQTEANIIVYNCEARKKHCKLKQNNLPELL